MKRVKAVYPYLVGLMVGFIMIPAFALGFNFSWSSMPWLGSFLMTLAMLAWPLFILGALLVSFTVYRDNPTRKKQWFRSLFLPPLGAVFSVIFVAGIYSIVN